MPNSYQPNDKSPASVQPVYVATCTTHGFFQDLCRTIGDSIFVHIVTSRVYITSMVSCPRIPYTVLCQLEAEDTFTFNAYDASLRY